MGSIGFLFDFEFYMAGFGVRRGPNRLVAPCRFKILDFQPDSSDMGQVPIDFHDVRLFQKSCHGFLTRYLSCFRPNRPKVDISSFLVSIKKMRDEKLCRFVVVSPREVPSLPVSCPFKTLNFPIILECSFFCRVSGLPKKCTLIVSVNRMSL